MYNLQLTTERIKALAKKKNVKVAFMLKELSLNKNLISSMQSRGSWPQANNLALVADYLNCSVDYLLGRSDLLEIASDQIPEKEKRIISLYRNDPEIKILIDRLLKTEETPPSPISLHPAQGAAKMVADDGNNETTTPEDDHAKRKALGRKYDQEQS